MSSSHEDKHINKTDVDKKNSTSNFVFPAESSETKDALDRAEKSIMESVASFARALDSTSPGLTKELLDIFDNLKKIGGIEESKLWETSFNLLYEKNADKIPDKIRVILKEMLDSLTQYNHVKDKSKTLEEMLKACASMCSEYKDCSLDIGDERTFIPGNLGNWKSN